MQAEIFDPNAQLLTTLQVNNSGTTWQDTLLETGTYTVVVTELSNNDTVNYHLALQRLFPAPASAMTLCIDCMVQDGINPIADSDVVLFDGDADETVLLTLSDVGGGSSSSTVQAEIYDPNAQFVTTLQVNNSGTTWQGTLLETGTYTVVVTELGNNGSVNYHLALQRLFPAPASAFHVASGFTLQENITPIGDNDVVLFDGTDGCTVRLTLTDVGGGSFS